MTKQNKIPFVTADFMSERSADNAPLTALLVAMQSNDPGGLSEAEATCNVRSNRFRRC